jgi:hypothetical protein
MQVDPAIDLPVAQVISSSINATLQVAFLLW